MKTLEQLGITTRRSFMTETSSTKLGDFEVSSSTKETTQLHLTLPQPAPFSATFSTEGLAQKVAKIFTSEVQTGDAEFDAAVYITTKMPEPTAHMLQSADVRALVREFLVNGQVVIDGNHVTLTVDGHPEEEVPSVVRFLNAILR